MKKKVFTLIQVCVTLLIFAWLFRSPENNRMMWESFTGADIAWIIASFVSFGIMRLFSVVRWNLLLKVQGIDISWPRLGALTLVGLFFNNFMPGGTGGDVIKTLYLLRETPNKKAEALLSVMMERLIGLIAMFMVAGIVLCFRYDWLMQTAATSGLIYTLAVISAGCLAIIGGTYIISELGLVQKLPAKLPMRSKFVDISVAYNLYGRAWRPSLAALLLSFVVHFFSFTQFYCAARAFAGVAEQMTFPDFLSIMPIIATITSVPISIGGTGVREGLFVTLLGDLFGIGAATATIISLTGYMVQLVWGLLGGIVYLFYRPSPLREAAEAPDAELANSNVAQ